MAVVDVHTHFVPRAYLDRIVRSGGVPSLRVERDGNGRYVMLTGTYRFPLSPGLLEPEEHLRRMASLGIDVHVVSTPTFLFHYSDPPGLALELSRIINDGLAEMVRTHPGRFAAMATVPLQDAGLACEELRRAREELGIRAVEIGSSIHGLPLDDASLDPFYAEAERLGVFVFVHPLSQWLIGQSLLKMAYLENLVGLPMNTAWAMGRVLFSGLPARFPRLRMGFAHVGGVSAFLLGRWDHGWKTRAESRLRLPVPPSEAARALYFDTVTHSPEVLEASLQWIAPEKLLLGSDYPFDMQVDEPLRAVRASRSLDEAAVAAILGGNAEFLFSLK